MDVLIFASHKAALTEYMHLSTVQENQRQLSLERLTALEARLVETERVKSDFISAVSNEWSPPLSEILSETERLMTAHQGEPRVVASSIHENAERLLGLARHWVDAWSAEGVLGSTREEVDVRALLDRVCHLRPGRFSSRRAAFRSHRWTTRMTLAVSRCLDRRSRWWSFAFATSGRPSRTQTDQLPLRSLCVCQRRRGKSRADGGRGWPPSGGDRGASGQASGGDPSVTGSGFVVTVPLTSDAG